VADYLTTCPQCGGELAPVAGDADSAPWLCAPCSRGWWPAELSAAARAAYRPEFADHGVDAAALAITKQRHEERAAARRRGTSLLHEHLAEAPLDQLQSLAAHPHLDPAFAAVLTRAIANRS
jgi:hypothetical protein